MIIDDGVSPKLPIGGGIFLVNDKPLTIFFQAATEASNGGTLGNDNFHVGNLDLCRCVFV